MNSEYFELDVRVTSIKFPDHPLEDKGGFIIFGTDKGTCKGFAPYPIEVGMKLRLKCREVLWHEQKQYEFRSLTMNVPMNQKVLLEYCCDITKGLGEKTAEKLYAEFGDDWRDKLDAMKPSIGNALKRTLAIFMADMQRASAITYATELGLTPRIGELAYAKWGHAAVAIMKQSPYSLVQLPRVGFKTIDAHREAWNIHVNSEFRAEAAIMYVINEYMEATGNSVISREVLRSKLAELAIDPFVAGKVENQLIDAGYLFGFDKYNFTIKKEKEHDEEILEYIYTYHDYLTNAGDFIPDSRLDNSQIRAIKGVLGRAGLTIVNGGAGSGKTTIIKEIVRAFKEQGVQYELCSFAGKAAARIREATGEMARTIHSMLGYAGESKGFTLKSLRGKAIIVDEASMVPSSLMYEIIKRCPARLILVGDQGQLPPVGIGSPFHDLVNNFESCVYTLNTCYRNKEAIFAGAAKVREGRLPEYKKTRDEILECHDLKSPEEIHKQIIELVKEGKIDFSKDLIISPRNGEGEAPTHATVNALNLSIQAIVNPHENGEQFKIGDRVMCIKNNASLDIWNGTTGWITRIDIDGLPYFKTDEGNEVKLPKSILQHIVPAYAMTIHKAQGSQYRNVYIVIASRDMYSLLNREMLYTAITRAKNECHIFTDANISDVVRTTSNRATFLQHKLNSLKG